MKNKAFYGPYRAQDGDIRVETFPASRSLGTPSQHTISRREGSQWKSIDGGNCRERKDERWTKGMKLAGTRGTTRYYRKLVS